jgi:hypothetical protein
MTAMRHSAMAYCSGNIFRMPICWKCKGALTLYSAHRLKGAMGSLWNGTPTKNI